MFGSLRTKSCLFVMVLLLTLMVMSAAAAAEDWMQFKYDCRHSGNVPDRALTTPLGLIGAVPLTDAVFTAPVVVDGRVYVAVGTYVPPATRISSPAVAGQYLHFGTMAGAYYVLDRTNGAVVREIACGEPIFSTPVVANNRVYFATLGSQIYAGSGITSGRLWTSTVIAGAARIGTGTRMGE